MTKEHISAIQAFALSFYLLVGSTVVLGVGTEAMQAAWLAVGCSAAAGLLLAFWYGMLLNRYPGLSLFDMARLQMGRWVAALLAAVYAVYFLYICARVLRDFCELANTVIFQDTPMEVIALTFALVIIYGVSLGLEVIARTTEIFLPYTFGFALLVSLLLFFGGDVDVRNALPVLPDGPGPVLKSLFPTGITFPFGEMVTFLVIGAALSAKSPVHKPLLLGVAASGVTLMFFAFVKVGVLGPESARRAEFPLLEAAKFVSIGNFIERLDALIVFTMMTGLFVKAGLYFYCGIKALSYLSGKNYRSLALPIGLLVSAVSIFIASNVSEFLYEGLVITPYWLHLPLQYAVPFVIGLAALLTRRTKGAGQANEQR